MHIGIDMDGVLCDFISLAKENAKKVFKISIDQEDVNNPSIADIVWNKISNKQKEKILKKIKDTIVSAIPYKFLYSKICPENFFLKLKPFPGAVGAVKKLYENNHKIIFITRPLEWRFSTKEKIDWLKYYFNDIEYSVIMISKMEDKSLINVDFMIDDDHRAIEQFPANKTICIEYPWNEDFRNNGYKGLTLKTLEAAVNEILKNKR